MKVTLMHHTPLWVSAFAVRECYDSHHKSDSYIVEGGAPKPITLECGSVDRELLDRVGNKLNHSSVKNHINYTFHCSDVSTKTLLALTRHDIGTEFSVQSTRFTTKKRKDKLSALELSTPERQDKLDKIMEVVQEAVAEGWSNDEISLLLPQAYHYSFVVTFSLSALQHFLKLRLAKEAHPDIQHLAKLLLDAVPDAHKFMFEDIKKGG